MPKPGKSEDRRTYIDRCMGDGEMNKEFPDKKQRAAVCYRQWRERGKGKGKKAESTAPMRAFDLAAQTVWAVLPESLQTILDVAARANDTDLDALAAKIGRPLDNTRAVTVRDGVAVVPVMGPLFPRANLFTNVSGATSNEVLAQDFTTALENPAVHSIVLDVDSPGGAISGVSELASLIHAGRGIKPVAAYVGDLSASGAYWIASAAGEVVINDAASVGSIGVVATVRTDAEKNRVEIVSSNAPGKRPDLATDEGRAQILAHIDALESVFVEAVARHRGVDAEHVLTRFGRGGLLVGKAAVEAGMADRLGSLESLIADLQQRRRTSTPLRGVAMAMTSPFVVKTTAELRSALAAGIDPENVEIGTEEPDFGPAAETARQEERARVAAILGCEEAKGRDDLARYLAFETDTQPKAAATILSKAPVVAEQPPAAPATAPAPKRTRLEAAMEKIEQPQIASEEPPAETPKSRAEGILAAYRTAHGKPAAK